MATPSAHRPLPLSPPSTQGVVRPPSVVNVAGLALAPAFAWLFIFHLDWRLDGAAIAFVAIQASCLGRLGCIAEGAARLAEACAASVRCPLTLTAAFSMAAACTSTAAAHNGAAAGGLHRVARLVAARPAARHLARLEPGRAARLGHLPAVRARGWEAGQDGREGRRHRCEANGARAAHQPVCLQKPRRAGLQGRRSSWCAPSGGRLSA